MQNEAKASKPYARLASREDALELAKNLRKEDLEEIGHSSGLPAETSLLYCLAVSNIAYAIVKDGRVIALMGVAEYPRWEGPVGTGYPWMMASPELSTIRKSFLRECREYVDEWVKYHGFLEGHVWAENKVHIKWLRWLGFELDAAEPYGIHDEPFMRFHMKDKDV